MRFAPRIQNRALSLLAAAGLVLSAGVVPSRATFAAAPRVTLGDADIPARDASPTPVVAPDPSTAPRTPGSVLIGDKDVATSPTAKLRIAYTDAPLSVVIAGLSTQSRSQIVLREIDDTQRLAEFGVDGETIAQALEKLASQLGDATWRRRDDGVYEVMSKNYYNSFGPGARIRKEIAIKNRDADGVAKVLSNLASSWGSVSADAKAKTVVVQDLPDRVQQMETLIKEIDRPAGDSPASATSTIASATAGSATAASPVTGAAAPAATSGGKIDMTNRIEGLTPRTGAGANLPVGDRVTGATNAAGAKLEQQIFTVVNREAGEIVDAMAAYATTDGSIASDARTNKIVVYDTADSIAKMATVLKEFDTPMPAETFAIKNADVAKLREQLREFLSTAGKITADERTKQIVVVDHPEALKRMREIVAALDKDVTAPAAKPAATPASTPAAGSGR